MLKTAIWVFGSISPYLEKKLVLNPSYTAEEYTCVYDSIESTEGRTILHGVPAGVQNEIDTVHKKNIMALYYFCDEYSKEKTAVEKSLTGAQYSKTRTSVINPGNYNSRDNGNSVRCVAE